jgi:hypothetical protein
MTINQKEKLCVVKTVLSTALGGLSLALKKKDILFQGDECVHHLRNVLPILDDKVLRTIVENTTVAKICSQNSMIHRKIGEGAPVSHHERKVYKAFKFLIALRRFFMAVRAIRDVLLIFSIGQPGRYSNRLRKSWLSFLVACYSASLSDELEVSLKKDFQILLALGCLKPVPRDFILFRGFLKRVLLRECASMNRGRSRSARLLRTLYESKRCWEKLSLKWEEKQKLAHKALLTSEAKSTKEALRWVKKAVDIVVPFGTRFKPSSCIPTYSSNITTKKIQGGNHSELTIGDSLGLAELGAFRELSLKQEMKCLKKASQDTHNNIVDYQALPEPGKFRVITKGPGPAYTALRPLQGFLLNAWKKLPCSSMNDEFEQKLHENMVRPCTRPTLIDPENSGTRFISGDYSNATDAMHRDATKCVLKRLSDNLIWPKAYRPKLDEDDDVSQEKYFELIDHAITSIEEVAIRYGDGGKFMKETMTKRGQLMGHPLSFPLLCIINLSTYMRTTGKATYSKLFGLKNKVQDPFFINGDDILFKGTSVDYDDWREYSGEVGLIVNEVKTYFHKKYYLINSILGKAGKTIEYVNLALAIGHRVKGEPHRLLLASATIFDTLSNYKEGASKCVRYFISTLARRLPKLSYRGRRFTPNFFVQKDLGGLGMRSQKPVKITGDQRHLASFLWQNPDKISYETLGSAPTSCQQALTKFRNMRPHCERILWEGPLRKEEDPLNFEDSYLAMCNQSTAWIKNDVVYEPENYCFRMNLNEAGKWKGKLVKKKKISSGLVSRRRIYG